MNEIDMGKNSPADAGAARGGRASWTSDLANAGWGFLVAWGLIMVFTGLFSEDGNANMGGFWTASMVGAPLGLLLFYAFGKCDISADAWKAIVLAALAFMTAGAVVMGLSCAVGGGLQLVLVVAAGFVSSLGTAALTVAWGVHYGRLDMAAVEMGATLSLLVAFACYAAALLLPRFASMALVLVVPLLSFVCLRKANACVRASSCAHKALVSRSLDSKQFTKLGLGIAAITAVVSLFWDFSAHGVMPLEGPVFSQSVLSGSVIALALMAYLSRFSRSLNLGTLYRWLLPLIAIAFSLLMFEGEGFLVAAALLVFAAQALLNLITFVYFAEFSQSSGASPVRVFGLGRFFVEVGFLIGMVASPFAARVIPLVGGSYWGVFFLALTLLIVVVMYSIANQDRLAFSLAAQDGGEASVPDASDEEGVRVDQESAPDAFQGACRVAAERFGLTPRESEILPYLAQGYSLPYIRNELHISQSTIDTHVRHIYRKMDLHSKEDVITYVRETSKML